MPSPYEHLFDGTISHSLTYLGIALMTGPATWRLFVSRHAPQAPTERRFFLLGAAMALLGAVINLRQATLSMTAALWLRFGPPQRALLWLPIGFALLGQSLVGHASAEGWAWPLWAYALHVSGGVAWLGGLLAWLGRLSHGYAASMTQVFTPFSRFARSAMLVILPAGLALSTYFIPSPRAVATPYGAALAIKLGLVAAILLVAIGHHRYRFPRIRSSSGNREGWKRLDDALLLETGLGVLVVIVAAMLSQIPPPPKLRGGSQPAIEAADRLPAGAASQGESATE